MGKNKKRHEGSGGDADQKQSSLKPDIGYIYLVKNSSSNELLVCASEEPLRRGSHVIAPSRYGLDYSVVVGPAATITGYEPGSVEIHGACLCGEKVAHEDDQELVAAAEPEDFVPESPNGPCYHCSHSLDIEQTPIPISGEVDWIERTATKEDYKRYLELLTMEDEALLLCREKVQDHKLDMKLVAAHYLFGEPKIIFFFTAANRVDFRNLVKDLVSIFRIRIELRQIGVRDESRLLGGLAVCGRDFCCHTITDKMNPVSIKMAKEQNLSLNSTKISGPCGRLLCCLSYEYDFYAEEKKNLPQEGSRLKIEQELMKISEVNVLSRKVSLVGQEGRQLTIPFSFLYFNDEKSRWEVDQSHLDEFLST